MIRSCLTPAIWLSFLVISFSTYQIEAAEIVSVFPIGSVKQVQQVTVRFSADMIALGDPRSLKNPMTVLCNVKQPQQVVQIPALKKKAEEPKFTTRWADTRNWVIDFDKPLASGIRCVLNINPEFKDLKGSVTVGAEEYSFATSGPALLAIAPGIGEIEPDQHFLVQTDGPINTKSVEEKAYFEVSGIPEAVKVKIITGNARDEILRAAIKSNWKWYSYQQILIKNKDKSISQIKEFESFFVFAAERRFPENAKVIFHWPQGILSVTGLPVEEPQEFGFKVIPPFQAVFNCERASADRPCNPILDMRLEFSKPAAYKLLAASKIMTKDGRTWIPKELAIPEKNRTETQTATLTFPAPFPAETSFQIFLPAGIKDDMGRPLANQSKFPLSIATDEYIPLVKFAAPFGILELKADPLLPMSLRNVEKEISAKKVAIDGKALNLSSAARAKDIIDWYKKVIRKDWDYQSRNSPLLESTQGAPFQVAKPLGEKEFELVGIPLKKPGFYVVEVQSPRLGNVLTGNGPMFVSTGVLVTDMAVHLKLGRESSLVWVTELSTGNPLAHAEVSILNSSGKVIHTGTTNKQGSLRVGPMKDLCGKPGTEGYSGAECEIFAFAKKGEDFSFVSNAWSKGIESYRYSVPLEYLSANWGPVRIHTVLDRMTAQPGDIVQMKHILREQSEVGFALMNQKNLPKRVLVVHQESRKTYTLPFDYDKKSGAAVGQFTIPKEATLGRYSIFVSNKAEMPQDGGHQAEDDVDHDSFDWDAQETGHFYISEYRLPLMNAAVKIQGKPLISPSSVTVDLSANYLSGGPAHGLKVKLRSSVSPGYFVPDVPGGSDFNFFSAPLKSGIAKAESEQGSDESFLKVQELKLEADGGLRANIVKIPRVTKIQNLTIEMEYTDPNGEIRTASATAPLFPADYVIGLRSETWFGGADKTKLLGVITDNLGKPQSHKTYSIQAFRTNYITHRKRLVGGFYSYDSKSEVISLGKVCEGQSDALGRFTCEPKNLPAGSIALEAKTTDSRGRATYAVQNISVYESGADHWWTPSDSDRIDILPEKNRYEPGEKAKIVIRSPFPKSTVLMTVEREGILDSFTTEISRDNPIVEVPLKGHYAPNVFISALVIRGRVGDPKATALIDLARPSMKMGITDVQVGWKEHELLVDVKTEKKKYQAREKVKVSVQVKTASGQSLPHHSEVALAAVDEGLMRLKENSSWKILKEMMGKRSLAVTTSSGQNQVIGRRHFGSKAKPPGGGGGLAQADPRELFEPVLFWQPRVQLDASGKADVTVPLNDSMTSFRLVAVATGGAQFFGDGSTTIESTKDLVLYSGFSPHAREGDQIQNALTVRNTTAQPMRVQLEVTSKEVPQLAAFPVLELKPSTAQTVFVSLTVPKNIKEIGFQIKAKDLIGGGEDLMKAKVQVSPAVPSRVLQATLFQLDKSEQVPVRLPTDALPNQGGLVINASSSLVSGLAGVKSYMMDYPYSCLEQRVSRAVVLENSDDIKLLIESLPSFLDDSGLLKFFQSSSCGSLELTSYVMNIIKANGFQIPEATKTKLVAGLSAYVQGRYTCENWWDRLMPKTNQAEKKIIAMDSLARYQAFSPDLLATIQITPNLWKTEVVVAWYKILKAQPQIINSQAHLKQAENILRSRVNFQGSSMNLQATTTPNAGWELLNSKDQEAIQVFGLAIEEPSWSEDAGRMARGIVARLRQGHWDTTPANAWGLTEFRRFSAKFEKEKLTGETQVKAPGVSEKFKFPQAHATESKKLNWPTNADKANIPVHISHMGTGKPWVHLQATAAIPLLKPWDMGYQISRKFTAVHQAKPGQWSIGDVVQVELTVVAKTDQAWVVVRDPIPAGASHLGTGLDGTSNLLDRGVQQKETTAQDWPTEFVEKGFTHFTSYAAYLSRGTYQLSYRIRLNSAGEFKLPQSRIEAMYSPETFGEFPNANWKVVQ